MPVEYRIDPERKLVITRGRGVVTDDDLLGHQRDLLADPDFDGSFGQLARYDEIERFDVSADAVRTLAAPKMYGPGVKRAFVVPSDVAFGLARMFQTLRDQMPEQIGVFRTLEEAERWIDQE